MLLSALTLHRLWSYDTPLKDKFKNKPFSCPACMAFWCGSVAVLLWLTTPAAVSIALAAYFPLRVWLWHSTKQPTPVFVSSTSTTTAVVSSRVPVSSTQTTPPPMVAVSPTQKTVVILTALSDFRPSYSVATAALDNALAIALVRPNWTVEVWTMQNCDPHGWENMPVNVKHRAIIPHMPWVENVTDETKAQQLAVFLQDNLPPWEDSVIITHDLMFVSWYTLFANAIHLIGAKYWRWFHIPHSLPGSREGRPQWITTMPGANHRVVTVARGMEQRFADYYQIPVERAHRIANVRDPRSWGTMSPRVRQIVTQTKLWSYDVVQVFPICTTRLEAKGFSKVVRTFALLNEKGINAFLLIANPNAGGQRSETIVKEAKEKALALGLSPDRWAFTSDLAPDTIPYGLSSDEIKSLWVHYGDVFLFPSMSEADSLVVREAQLCRQLVIGNASVSTLSQPEDADARTAWGVEETVSDAVCRDAAGIVERNWASTAVSPRKHVLRTRNLETLGEQWAQLLNNP